ncbi:MAG: ABC transporter ATP-binding protein [Lentisphaeria bacterium]|nr:ABC transporter ATP-binding protein [Lentisphaeria bacterium]
MGEVVANQDIEQWLSARLAELPADVQQWLGGQLGPDERIAGFFYADILPDGGFGERWNVLTNERYLVLEEAPEGGGFQIAFQVPLADVQGARLRTYIGSAALILTCRERAHEVARFGLGSQHEAADLSYYVKEIVKGREEGRGFDQVSPPVTQRPQNRCSKCGRALGRWNEVCTNCMDRRQILLRLMVHLVPYLWMAALGLSLTLLITALNLMPPYLNKILIDQVITPRNLPLLPKVVLALAGVSIASAVVSVFRSNVMQWVGQKVLLDMRTEIYERLQMLRLRFYAQRETGRIMARVTSDLGRLQHFVSEGVQEMIVNIATMLIIASILLAMNWRLFLLALAPTPIIAVSTYLFGRRIHLLFHRIWRRSSGLTAILADTIPGIRVVKAFAQERRETAKFQANSEQLFSEEMRAVRLSSAFFPFLHLQTTLGSILIFSVGGYMVIHGAATVGTLVAFTSYLWRFYMPVQNFGQMNQSLQRSLTSAERVFEILDADPEPIMRPGLVLEQMRGEVEFRNIRFSYEPGKYALDDVSFTVHPGEMIGLVGPSGAGKSTLAHLIARFYEVEEGGIYIDGHDVRDFDLQWFRQQIGVVLQDPYLFRGTIWENIAYANPDASAEEILAAAKAANAHEFVMNMPDGYDTMIGERGQSLSGGERQRISIARAVLRDPKILILDEATASVDTETESKIQLALERLIENRTTFAIAHRLSTLRKASRLVVLDKAKLAEMGTHDELLAQDGLFAKLCRMQDEISKVRAL